MALIPLRDLEAARRDPGGYRRESIDSSAGRGFGPTYSAAVRHATSRYHKVQDGAQARRYLEDMLNRQGLQRRDRVDEAIEQLDWYVGEHISRSWPLVRVRERIVVPLPPRAPHDLVCSGEVFRLDMDPNGGYAGWLLLQKRPTAWRDQLRFPLIQLVLSQEVLNAPVDEVAVGIIALADRAIESHTFSPSELSDAELLLDQLLARMGY